MGSTIFFKANTCVRIVDSEERKPADVPFGALSAERTFQARKRDSDILGGVQGPEVGQFKGAEPLTGSNSPDRLSGFTLRALKLLI